MTASSPSSSSNTCRSSAQVFGSSVYRQKPLGSSSEPIHVSPTCTIRPHISLARLTSFRVGGPAEFYVAPRSIEDVQASLAWANQHDVPVTMIGAGSNLLVSDRGIPGLVICTRQLKHTSFDLEAGQVTVSAGESLARLSWQAAEQGWRGLEWAVGIPGTIGGGVVMNAGAHQSCTADVLVNAQVLTENGTLQFLSSEGLGFQYRTSMLQNSRLLVTQATFQLNIGGIPENVLSDTREHLKKRHATQPYHLPSCGSVFRNPASHTAGWLIEQTGLKGHQIGGAQVARRHANFILNLGDATANDIFNLIHHVQECVEHQWSLLLHPEVKLIGEF